MKELGISLTDQEGNMKSLDTLVRDMRGSFSGLSKEQQLYHASVLAGKTAMPAMLALMNTAESDYNELAYAINNCSGATDEMAKIMQSNAKGDMIILKSSIEGLGIAFGEALEPKVRSFLQTATGMVNSFSGMSDWSKNLLIDITGLGLGIGATLKIFGTVKSVMGSFKLGMVATDIGNVSGAIQMMGFKLTGLATSLGISTAAAAGLVLGIGAIAVAIGGWIYWMATADKRLAEFNANLIKGMEESRDKIKNNTEEIKNAKQALAEIQELENKVNGAQNESDRASATQELIDKKKEILQMYPELAGAFSSEAEAMDGLTGSLENYIKMQQEQLKMEQRKLAQQGREYLDTNKVDSKSMSSEIDGYAKAKKSAEEYSKTLDRLAKLEDDELIPVMRNGKTELEKVGDIRKSLNEGLEWSIQLEEEHNGKLNDYYQALKAVKEAGGELTSEQTKALAEYEKALNEGFNSDVIPQTVQNILDGLNSMGSEVEIIASKIGASTEEVNSALSRMGEVALLNFGNLNDEAANALGILSTDLETGAITLGDFNTALDTMSIFASEAFTSLPVSSQEAMSGVINAFANGDIAVADFQSAVNAYMGLAADNFKGLNQESQNAINGIVTALGNGEISASEYQTAIGLMSAYVDGNFQKLPPSAQQTMAQLKSQFNNGEINASQFASGVGKALGLTESDLASLAGASASDIGSLISDLLSGKLKANELQGAIAALQSKKITVTTEYKQIGASPVAGGRISGATIYSLTPPTESTDQPPTPTIDTYSVSPMSTPATPSPTSESTPTATPMASGDSSSSATSPVSTGTPTVSTYANNSFTNVWDKDPYEGMSDDAKKEAQNRVQAEEDAKRAILALRNDLYKALKNKIEKQKKDELDTYDKKLSEIKKKYDEQKSYEESIYDARIDVIKKEMELLDKSVNPSKEDNLKEEEDKLKEYQKTLSKLEAEKEKWLKNDSAMGREQAKKIQTQIDEQNKVIEDQQKAVAKAEVDLKKEKLQENIDLLEEEKKQTLENMEKQQEATIESVENEKQVMLDKYEQLLSDEALYLEANKMMQKNNMDDILKMLTEFAPDFSDIGILLGKSLAEAMSGEIKKGVDGWDYIKNPNNKPTTPSNPSPSPSPTPTLPEPEPPKQEDKPKKGKITASGLNVRSGAGTNNKILDSVYRNDEVDIIESKDGWYYVDYYSKWRKKRDKGWVSGNYVQPTFHTGGVIGDMDASSGIAIVKSKERVLTESQNRVFEGLVYDWIPKLERMFSNIPSTNNIATTNGLTYNSTYNVVNHTDFDANNMEDNILYNLKKQMKSMGKRF